MCSLRSWPTQNARPVPVSTTQRTAASSATWRTAASSASLVATSRLFIASGRLRVMVATPSATSSRTGEASVGHARRLSHGRPGSGPRTGRSAGFSRVGLAGEQLGSRLAGPVAREQLGRQPGVVEQELAPLVHEPEPGRERRLVLVGRSSGSRADERSPPASGHAAYDVARPDRSQAPTGSGRSSTATACRAVPPARATTSSTSGRSNGHSHTAGACSAYPR